MLKTSLAACLVATALATLPALAQTPPPPSGATDRPAATGTGAGTSESPAMQPGTSPAPTDAAAAPPAGGVHGQFATQLQDRQMMASKLIGTTVVSTNNEAIGDVNDAIFDRGGQIVAVVVGVGGFLGIGEKDVAVSFPALDFDAVPERTAAAPATATPAAAPTATGATGAAAAPADDGGVPNRIVLKMTKAELQAAPAFRPAGAAPSTTAPTTK